MWVFRQPNKSCHQAIRHTRTEEAYRMSGVSQIKRSTTLVSWVTVIISLQRYPFLQTSNREFDPTFGFLLTNFIKVTISKGSLN